AWRSWNEGYLIPNLPAGYPMLEPRPEEKAHVAIARTPLDPALQKQDCASKQ
ncbi:hypothetical protein P7K49_006801, partial [Saguinus oedipus]